MALNIGQRVGSRRWPYSASHPDCWQMPYIGVIESIRGNYARVRYHFGTISEPLESLRPEEIDVAEWGAERMDEYKR